MKLLLLEIITMETVIVETKITIQTTILEITQIINPLTILVSTKTKTTNE